MLPKYIYRVFLACTPIDKRRDGELLANPQDFIYIFSLPEETLSVVVSSSVLTYTIQPTTMGEYTIFLSCVGNLGLSSSVSIMITAGMYNNMYNQ